MGGPGSGPPRAQCGTISGYQRHKRLGERACIPCCDAWAAYWRAYHNREKEL